METNELSLELTETALFKDNLLFVAVDASNVVAETDETNNIKHTYFDCGTNFLDLTASFLRVDCVAWPSNALLIARLGNGGDMTVSSGVDVAFYQGDPATGGSCWPWPMPPMSSRPVISRIFSWCGPTRHSPIISFT